MATLALTVVFAAAAGLFVVQPILRPRSRLDGRLQSVDDEDKHLAVMERRDRALAALTELEFDHRTGNVSDVDYRELIAPLRREAAEALKALERAESGTERALDAKRAGRARARLAVARHRR